LNRRLLVIAFVESFAAVMVQRGVYFFSRTVLGFSDGANLSLALVFGISYVVGALLSHRTCIAVGERRVLLVLLVAQAAVHTGMALRPAWATVFAGLAAIGALNGMKWPVIESYVSAGQAAAPAARSVGRFNISWAVAVPLALAATGPVLHAWPAALFLIPGAVNLGTFALARALPQRPEYLLADHPHRLQPVQLGQFRSLMISARWLLLLNYAAMWILAALLPGIMGRLGFRVSFAAGLSSLVDVARLLAFVWLNYWTGWHGRAAPLVLAIAALPAGFFLVLLGQTAAAVFIGQALFGLAAGMIYYAALYYALVVKNASVDAGGGHEGLIGLGFAIGPAAGLAAMAIQLMLPDHTLAALAGIGPLFIVCLAASARYAASAASPKPTIM